MTEHDQGQDVSKPPQRRRVVLAERRGARKVMRTIAHLEEQTGIGEFLVKELIRRQLRVSLVLAATTAVLLGSLPMLFAIFPEFADSSIMGLRVPWVLLGAAAYPLLIGIGALHNRMADRHEKDFVHIVES